MPRVSVVMPLFNAENFVKKSIDSILAQTYDDFELLLVDDCSVDETINIVKNIRDSRIRIINNDVNCGIAYSRNRGLDEAVGEFIALMDDDDLAPVNRLMKQVSFLDDNPEIDVVGGRWAIIDENDEIIRDMGEPLVNPNYIKASLMFYDPIGNGSTMIRKNFLDKFKIRYSDGCLGMEDYKFWIDCATYGKISSINETLLYWRDSTVNESARVAIINQKGRREKFSELQQYAMNKQGIKLTDDSYCIFHRMFPEGSFTSKASLDDLKKTYSVLNLIIDEAKELKLDNEKEITQCCIKQFSKRLESSDVWK